MPSVLPGAPGISKRDEAPSIPPATTQFMAAPDDSLAALQLKQLREAYALYRGPLDHKKERP